MSSGNGATYEVPQGQAEVSNLTAELTPRLGMGLGRGSRDSKLPLMEWTSTGLFWRKATFSSSEMLLRYLEQRG